MTLIIGDKATLHEQSFTEALVTFVITETKCPAGSDIRKEGSFQLTVEGIVHLARESMAARVEGSCSHSTHTGKADGEEDGYSSHVPPHGAQPVGCCCPRLKWVVRLQLT